MSLHVGGILFVVIEYNPRFGKEDNLADNITKLFLALLAAAEQNVKHNFANLKICGLLSSFSRYYFYTYNPHTKKIFKNSEMSISDRTTD
ncbi:hypothetical protein M413DRAFT_63999 [Hebeloma cylindrosporum]|uniref:Uncharacterized protein n=1 Tax=Hebeloma cylindrosporum TaxID=76867 RepID=A0A0C2Z201_HEBCY|nr:hypothetical protein M413DRAFT_63999 [Hebeloma cylindrosporum h7]